MSYKFCSVYFRPTGVFVLSKDRTSGGLLIGNNEGSFLGVSDAVQLTQAVMGALDKSKWNAPQPENLMGIGVPDWVREQKIKSWNALEKGSRLFGVQLDGENLIIEINKPYRSGGFLVDRVETYPANRLVEVGLILLQLVKE